MNTPGDPLTIADATSGCDGDDVSVPARPRGRPPVPRNRIIATALEMLDEAGADALSLRALAQRLGSSTATLYRHFANRAELLNHVIDHTFGSVPLQADELLRLDWDDACQAMAAWMFETLRNHPNVAPLLLDQAPTGPNAMALRELALRVLLNAGFPPAVAIRCYATLARFVLGFAIQLTGEEADGTALADAVRTPGGHGFPATAAVTDMVPLDDEFSFGLGLLLTGLVQQRDRLPGSPSA